ncbi:MAG: ABC transporter permease [Alicyclobacillus sp.]|nr:ABC transporter permease [Alicyclobacillus sp.]
MNLWRHRSLVLGGVIVGLIVLAAVVATVATPYDPNKQNYTALLQGVSGQHWLGTDQLGRDVFSRILVGARTSLIVAAGAVLVALVIGIPVGLISGFYRGFWDDWVIMRIVDALQAFPFLILALVLAAVMGPGIRNAMIAIGIGYLPVFIRIVRGQVLAEVRKEYVDSARVVGCSDWRIMLRHIFPNITTPLIVQVTVAMAGGIVAEASLSYLGLGVIPPTASWGTMLHDAQGYLSQDAMLAVVPGLAIAVAVLGFNLLGEGLQEIWDPKLKE